MSDNVVILRRADERESADGVLDKCRGNFKSVLVIGWSEDGKMQAALTEDLDDGREIIWLIECFRHQVMTSGEGGE